MTEIGPDCGTRTNYRKGCRCPLCKEANREGCRKAKAGRLANPVPKHLHGTSNAYFNYACRCAPCMKAGSEANKRVAAKRKERVAIWGIPDGITHGYSGFKAWGCRCETCVEAQREYRRTRNDTPPSRWRV